MIALESHEDRVAAAAEYVLGTLEAADMAAVEDAARRDRTMGAEIHFWQDSLLALTARTPAIEPSPDAWTRIAARIAAADVVSSPHAHAAPGGGVIAATSERWWRRLRVWQSAAALAVAASLVLSVVLVTREIAPDESARYVAVLQAPDSQSTGYLVEVTAGRSVRLVPVIRDVPVPAGRSLQFWTKPLNATGPTSLGLVRAGEIVDLPISRLPAVEAQTLFEITLEPEAGSPIGRPTGPILYVGRSIRM